MQWPPFLPPSLKALSLTLKDGPWSLSLLRSLPGMLEASGAGLERLEVDLDAHYMGEFDDRLVHLARLLRCCSPTLKVFDLAKSGSIGIREGLIEEDEHRSRMERLRVQWVGVMASVFTCRELEVLLLPRTKVETLFPPGSAFNRLTQLAVCDFEPPTSAGEMGLWEVDSGVRGAARPGQAQGDARGPVGWGGGGEISGGAGVGGCGRHPDAPQPRGGGLW
jgi:hypothetical protein